MLSQSSQKFTYDEALQALSSVLGDRLQTSPSVCRQYGKDESFHPAFPPHGVVKPRDKNDVQEIVKICHEYELPIIPYGAGTSLEGNVAAIRGGITLDMTGMNNIISVNREDGDVIVQPGVTRRQLNHHLKDSGLFFPIDPGADATIGGMTGTRASGTNAVRYGSMRDNVLNIEAVLADGSLIQTAKRSRKSAAGYDLTRLMIGSEGTLGIFTELTIKLHPVPEKIAAAVCVFDDLDDAVNTTIQMIQYGIPVARVELLDHLSIKAINLYSKTNFQESPTLFLEFHGSEQGVTEQAELTQAIAKENRGGTFKWTTKTEQRNEMWRARHDAAYATKLLHPKGEIWATDVCVPISRLSECIQQTQKDIDELQLLAPVLGHVGDGNFHLLILVDHDNQDEVNRANLLHEKMVMRALDMEGTCTGEHGIGYGKIDFLVKEHGQAVEPMKWIKQALDPKNILNPGKIFS